MDPSQELLQADIEKHCWVARAVTVTEDSTPVRLIGRQGDWGTMASARSNELHHNTGVTTVTRARGMDVVSLALTAIGVGASIVCAYFAFRPLWRLQRLSKRLAVTGIGEVGTVVEIERTGTEINDMPLMRVVLDIHPAGGTRRQVTIKQLMDILSVPRAGDTVYLATDPADPAVVLIVGGPKAEPITKVPAPEPTQWTDEQELDLMSLTTRLRERGIRGIATVLAVEAGEGQDTRFHLEVDSVVEAKRVVTVTQIMYRETYAVGDRAYLLIDPDDPNIIALLPLSLSGGRKPDRNYRLDSRVLGPQLLREGAKGHATVLSAVRLSAPHVEALGYARFLLRVRIVPGDGSDAYEAERDMDISSEEKVRRWATVGSVLPVRYDWHDRTTFCCDLMSLGYPDPYLEYAEAVRAH